MESKETPFQILLNEVIESIRVKTKSKKLLFDFNDAYKYKVKFSTPRESVLLDTFKFLKKNPLKDNDYFKFVNSYFVTGKKLSEKYFRHDLKKLHLYYSKIDDAKKKGIKINVFSQTNYENYVLFMALKLNGLFEENDNLLFNIEVKDNREYNPLSKIPSVLRGCLPFEVKEYDIKCAFPSFIDIELESNFRHSIYEKVNKSEFAMYLNSNCESKVSIETARKGIEPIYGTLTEKVITNNRYNEKGRAFKDFTIHEKKYIELFTEENNLKNYARLHDGIFVLQSVNCENLVFGIVEFSIKESIKPEIINNVCSFYSLDEFDEVLTCPTMYADFFKQEKFIRISSNDDKIQLLKNTNNVVEFFNHKTDVVSFLESEINETIKKDDKVRNKIARDNSNVLQQSFLLLEPNPLIYYKDTKTSFGLPFKNGFFYFDTIDKLEIKQKEYSDVNGFFSAHEVQKKEFQYTDEIGDFEVFIQRISTGVKEFADLNDEQKQVIKSFHSMIGYLCHNYKAKDQTHAIILTDEGANDETRNGGRGKTQTTSGIKKVTKTLEKAGNEFVGDYIHNYADLDKSHNVYLIDDVPAGFNYNDLYTPITGGINVQPKGSKANQIEFEDSPKFIITTNWLVRYDEKDASTNRRFAEFKIKPYYNLEHQPKNEFGKLFFDDWDASEWNKFYSFIFRSVFLYLNHGLIKIKYDKTEDNYMASFGSDVVESEMKRIIDELMDNQYKESFNVTEFLWIYNEKDNPLKSQSLFSKNNTKKLIEIYLQKHRLNELRYDKKSKRWIKL